jgi:hypothetical protein
MEMLLHGSSDQQVAQRLGVERSTIYRWRRWRVFAKELQRQRDELHKQTTHRLRSMFDPALEVLQKLLASSDPKVALRAAGMLLNLSTAARDSAPVMDEAVLDATFELLAPTCARAGDDPGTIPRWKGHPPAKE